VSLRPVGKWAGDTDEWVFDASRCAWVSATGSGDSLVVTLSRAMRLRSDGARFVQGTDEEHRAKALEVSDILIDVAAAAWGRRR